jgi:hypothetical protein
MVGGGANGAVSLRFRLSEILRGPGETCSDVILKLVEKSAAKPATNGAGSSRAPPIRDVTRRS